MVAVALMVAARWILVLGASRSIAAVRLAARRNFPFDKK
jgi:hypothetical protein